MKTIRACFAAVLAACLLPATASAATVSVVEETLAPVPPRERATLLYEGTSGEDNIASIVPAGEEGDSLRYEVTDLHAPLTAGPGCSGGGAPGVAATCLLPRSRPPTCYGSACTDGGRQIVFRFALGDGDDELRGARIPPDDGGGGNIAVQAEGGVGDDQLYTGQTSDTLDPGPGSDTVRSNQGDDVVDAGDSPDGADHYDLRDGLDQITYFNAGRAVSVTLDSKANDGAAGEKDRVVDAEWVFGTPRSDTLVGSAGADALRGEGGADLLIGKAGSDYLSASPRGSGDSRTTPGDSVLHGGPGRDTIFGAGANDRATGNGGRDALYLENGADRAGGGAGTDYVDGGQGEDRLTGGAGSDRLNAGYRPSVPIRDDNALDHLDCGSARRDRAIYVGGHDHVERCERVSAGE